jgi:superfamily I DNA and/or RNA helicase
MQAALAPLAIYDVSDGQEENSGRGSIENWEEARFVVALLNALFAAHPHEARSIAVITPYRAQVPPLNPGYQYEHTMHLRR